ncbi:enoyl-CoA hydratase/isomerase domain-containing protein [Hirsutella rhossiliensis]|uniref:3-hydroxyisobutyryl-CoA hydrolase n=1 Tax=Hirsutella rhossiliensis TaxID=111463 RepID=A0A9P8SKE5_9HYPO|nr:enoyl-CoA hydratase/isomerase domain-containing protein [Hirsutella rhossiliensis]KAH0965164.1 enoyl-CoA hydratase/isomerase domain-containing protein [Hirsutella rhossiliensis]
MAQSAKVLSCSWGARQLSTEAASIKELPGDEPNDVVFESRYGLRTVMLNRPKKLNSLNGSMIRKIVPRLVEWEKSDMANVIVMKGAGPKALCAGGDVAALAQHNQQGADGWKKSADYFALEYKLDHYIATYSKPYVAIMDGITMGGGVGLSIHAPFRIATERTVFAMPETTIGFFPDVGASFFLPRMNGSVGTYLALTSDRLTGPNVFYTGIATHYLHSTSLPDLEARLAELRFLDDDPLPRRLEIINDTLEEFCTGLPFDQSMQLSGEVRRAIDRCFNKNNVDDIMASLKEERGETEAWAQKQLDTLQKRSPTSVHVTLRQMRVGGKWDIAEAFNKEFQIASKFMQGHDFTEGVTALLVRKETPKWQPESLEAIPASDNVAKPFFDFDQEASLELFSDRTYSQYPFAALGVPTEKEIEDMVTSKSYTPKELTKAVVASRRGRQGIADVAKEIIARKTKVDDDGVVKWLGDESVATSRL